LISSKTTITKRDAKKDLLKSQNSAVPVLPRQVLNVEAANDGSCKGDRMTAKHAFVMMVQKRWWDEFCRRSQEGKSTHSFVLRGAAPPKDASRVLFYVTKPVGEISGYADFIERKVGNAEMMWKEYGKESVLSSKAKYLDFIRDSKSVSFVRFKNLHEAAKGIPLNRVLTTLGVRRLGRKGFYLNGETEREFTALLIEKK